MPPKTPQHQVVTERMKGSIVYDIAADEIVVVMRIAVGPLCNDSDRLRAAADKQLMPFYLALMEELARDAKPTPSAPPDETL